MFNTLFVQQILSNIGQKHPYIFFGLLFIGAPLGVLLAVTVCTIIIALPIYLVFG